MGFAANRVIATVALMPIYFLVFEISCGTSQGDTECSVTPKRTHREQKSFPPTKVFDLVFLQPP